MVEFRLFDVGHGDIGFAVSEVLHDFVFIIVSCLLFCPYESADRAPVAAGVVVVFWEDVSDDWSCMGVEVVS